MDGEAARRWAVLAVLSSAEFINVLAVTAVVVALPAIGASLGLSGAGLQWVASIYALLFGSLVLVGGRAADLYGRRRLFAIGLAGFAVTSLIGGLAANGSVLIMARAGQGLAAAVTVPAALSLLTDVFPEGRPRDRAVGVLTAAGAGGGALGFFVGGVVTEALGWRWVFWMNVPACAAAVIGALLLLAERRDRTSPPLDLLGAATITGGLLLLIYAFTVAEQAGFGSAATLLALAAAAALVMCAGLVEARVRHPLVPPATLTSGGVSGPVVASFTLTASTGGAAVLGTLYLQEVLGHSAAVTGLAYVPFSLAVIVGSSVGPWLSRRLGPRVTTGIGLTTVAVALGIATAISTDQGLMILVTALTLSGGGLGCASVAATATGVSAVASEQRGMASGLLNAAAQVGTAVGIAAILAVAGAASGTTSSELVVGYRWGFLTSSCIVVLGLLMALRAFRQTA